VALDWHWRDDVKGLKPLSLTAKVNFLNGKVTNSKVNLWSGRRTNSIVIIPTCQQRKSYWTWNWISTWISTVFTDSERQRLTPLVTSCWHHMHERFTENFMSWLYCWQVDQFAS